MPTRARNNVVHLELHSPDLAEAGGFYAELFGWQRERVHTPSGSYLAVGLGDALGGGFVESATPRSLWLPYVEVGDVRTETKRAEQLGASVLLGVREGPAGWRSVVGTRSGGEIALWQSKR